MTFAYRYRILGSRYSADIFEASNHPSGHLEHGVTSAALSASHQRGELPNNPKLPYSRLWCTSHCPIDIKQYRRAAN